MFKISGNVPSLWHVYSVTRQLNPPPSAAHGGGEGKGGRCMYLRPRDSNATVGVRDRATGKALEGADRQTDRQTFRTL